jgi:hypothetical protein
MLTQKKQILAHKGQMAPVIKTEGPLCEKDEQGLAIERTKLLQKEALEKWQRLKRNRT